MIEAPTQVTPSDVARHYDEIDLFYREMWGEHLHHGLWQQRRRPPETAVQDLLKLVIAKAEIRPGQAVCDVGCGYGATTRYLAERKSVRATGFTISEKQYHYARSKNSGGRCSYVLGDWLGNGLPSDSQDAVLSIESSEHFADKPGFFQEVFRVLRPDGRFVVCAWLAAEKAKPWQVRRLLKPICSEGRLPSLGTAVEYRDWMETVGLQDIQLMDLSSRVSRTWTICARRLLVRLATRFSSWRFLLNSQVQNRNFALAVLRIWLAYRSGCLRYGLFSARKMEG